MTRIQLSHALALASAASFLTACPPPDDCSVGSEGCACTEGGACDDGLQCLSDLCVESVDVGDGDGDTVGDGDGDTVGDGDGDVSGDGDGDVSGDGDGDGDGDTSCGLPLCLSDALVDQHRFYSDSVLLPIDDERVFFIAARADDSYHMNMGITDGTAAGTTILIDDIQGDRYPYHAVNRGSRVVAQWNKDGDGNRFFGIDAETGAFEALTPVDDNAREVLAASQGFVMRTDDGVWVSDGTASGTQLIYALTNASDDYKASELAQWGDRVVFMLEDESADTFSLQVSTGSGSATSVGALPGFSFTPQPPQRFAAMADGSLWFYWPADGARSIWKATLSSAPVLVVSPAHLQGGNQAPSDFTASGPYLYYTHYSSDASARLLYRTDGTEGGTIEVWRPAPGESGVVDGDALGGDQVTRNLIADGQGGVWFRGSDPETGLSILYHANGTSASPVDAGTPPDGVAQQQHNGSGPMDFLNGRLYAAGYPYAVEVEASTHRRMGIADDPSAWSNGVETFVQTGDRIWVGGGGLYFIDRPAFAGDGDGDGDGDSVGDGDGDGDVYTASAVVTANGNFIGYLVDVWDYTFRIYDPAHDVVFALNPSTGYVAGSTGSTLHTDAACDGQAYHFGERTAEGCGTLPAPNVRTVRAVDGDGYGLTQPTAVWLYGSSQEVAIQYQWNASTEVCQAWTNEPGVMGEGDCMAPILITTDIPAVFATPIEVSGSAP